MPHRVKAGRQMAGLGGWGAGVCPEGLSAFHGSAEKSRWMTHPPLHFWSQMSVISLLSLLLLPILILRGLQGK